MNANEKLQLNEVLAKAVSKLSNKGLCRIRFRTNYSEKRTSTFLNEQVRVLFRIIA